MVRGSSPCTNRSRTAARSPLRYRNIRYRDRAASLRKSQLTSLSGVSRSQAWRPSGGTGTPPLYLSANSRSGSARTGSGVAVRGTSPTGTTAPDSSTPRSSRVLHARVDDDGDPGIAHQVGPPLAAHHRAQPQRARRPRRTTAAPRAAGRPCPAVATRQVRSAARNSSTSAAVMAMARPRRCARSVMIQPFASSGPGPGAGARSRGTPCRPGLASACLVLRASASVSALKPRLQGGPPPRVRTPPAAPPPPARSPRAAGCRTRRTSAGRGRPHRGARSSPTRVSHRLPSFLYQIAQ